MMWFALTSKRTIQLQLSDAGEPHHQTAPAGAARRADLRIFGERKTSMRINIEPTKLACLPPDCG